MADIPPFMHELADEWERTDPSRIDFALKPYAQNAYFRDPFNEFHGVDKIRAVLIDMYEMLDNVSFDIHGISAEKPTNDDNDAHDGRHIYFRWTMSFGDPNERIDIPGITDFIIDTSTQLITHHVDHWDSGRYFYRRLPILGWVIRQIEKRLSVD